MIFNLKENKKIEEKYFYGKHESGLNIIIFPKKHSSVQGVFAVKYGSADSDFTTKDGEIINIPDGTAHFLEHKMFENEDGEDSMEKYARYGGSANAYTSFDKTVYIFSATDYIYENLKVLLEIVAKPWFTPENVAKEQEIIAQEINMYEDNPEWQSFFGAIKCMYKNHSIKNDIAGTVQGIREITDKVLYDCYNAFYNLNNMVLCLCGDVARDKITETVDKVAKKSEFFDAKPVCLDEPEELVSNSFIKELEVSQPIYCIGLKCPKPSEKDSMKEQAAVSIILDIMFSKSSRFYNDCYANGLFNKFRSSYTNHRNQIAFIEFSGSSNDPDKLLDALKAEIDNRRSILFNDEEFNRAKKVMYADYLGTFDSTEDIADAFVSFYFQDADILDYADVIESVDKKYAEDCFLNIFNNSKLCISKITPKKQEV